MKPYERVSGVTRPTFANVIPELNVRRTLTL